LVGLCSIVLLANRPAAQAAEIIVTSTDDSGPGTLRDALASAANRGFISFSVTGTIAITSGSLVVTNGLTIEGPGPDQLEIDGNGSGSVFQVGPVKSAKRNPVWIAGLGITGGGNIGVNGGGINNDGAILTVSNCVVNGNTAFEGGGIYSGGSKLEVVNCTVSGNISSGTGGGVSTLSNCTTALTNCTVSGNSAAAGGGISNQGMLTVAAGTISKNQAKSAGGGISMTGGSATITASAFTANQVNSSGNALGGGVYLAGSLLALKNCTVSANQANGGAGASGVAGGNATGGEVPY